MSQAATDQSDYSNASGQAHATQHTTHIMPFGVLVAVIACLLFLTWLTVVATWVNLGEMNVWVALFIALAKASLVGLYFMHLRYDNPIHGMMLIVALFFVVVLMGIALIDSSVYTPSLTSTPAAHSSP